MTGAIRTIETERRYPASVDAEADHGAEEFNPYLWEIQDLSLWACKRGEAPFER